MFSPGIPANNPKFTLETFFADHLTKDTKMISGGDFLKLSKLATSAGFSDAEFKNYLSERGIEINTLYPPQENSPHISIHTPDNGKQFPDQRQ